MSWSSDLALAFILLIPVSTLIPVFFSTSLVFIRNTALLSSVLTFFLTISVWLDFNDCFHKLFYNYVNFDFISGYTFYFSLDGVSLLFVLLTSFLMPICFLSIQGTVDKEKEYICALLLLHTLMNCIFCVSNVLLFYIFFESVLIPMYFIIGVMGSRLRRIYASYLLVLYTLFGSVPMLFGIIYLYSKFGTFDYYLLWLLLDTDHAHVTLEAKRILWLAFFMGFAVKVPMIPFHIWLPEAHVEAPTAGSVILAGILLKVGTYGFLRYSLPLFQEASTYFSPLVYILSSVAIVYTAFTTLRQIDLKKIVAYSSVAHMGYVTLGLFSLSCVSVEGSILIMISHGFVSSALFLCIGVIYDRYKTRIYKYYSGLAQFMPVFTIFFLLFTMANLGLPGTSSFPGEFLVILGISEINYLAAIFAVFGTILSAAYALWMFNRVSFGVLKTTYLSTVGDLNRREFLFLVPLGLCTLLFGIYPDQILKLIHLDILTILNLDVGTAAKDASVILETHEPTHMFNSHPSMEKYLFGSSDLVKPVFSAAHPKLSAVDTSEEALSYYQNKYNTYLGVGDSSLDRGGMPKSTRCKC